MASNKYVPAVLKALRFHEQSAEDLEAIPDKAWPKVLDALDRAHLTLALGVRRRDLLPEAVRSRVDRNLSDNRLRHDRLIATQHQITSVLISEGIEHVVLKGLSQWPLYVDDPSHRPQYDIDLCVPGESIRGAAKAIHKLGYGFVNDVLDPGADHLPVMIRKTGWVWRSDYYDPEMPPSVDLHFRFWNSQRMRFGPGEVAQFWRRRVVREVAGLRFWTLDPVDGLSYSALHLLRHLLGGDMRLRHIYEIANLLESSAGDDAFWANWRDTGLVSCRVIEGIAFRLASEWFRCNLHPIARSATEELPPPVRRWFSLFASLPPGAAAAGIDHTGKSELWLHFCLLGRGKDKRRVAIRRLLPIRRARVVQDPHVPLAKNGPKLRMRRVFFEASFLADRFLHHVQTVVPTIRSACVWCFANSSPADHKRPSGSARFETVAAIPAVRRPRNGPSTADPA